MNDVWTSTTQRYSDIQPSFISFRYIESSFFRLAKAALLRSKMRTFNTSSCNYGQLKVKAWKLPQIGVGITKSHQFIVRNRGKPVQLTRWQRRSLKAIVLCVNAEIYLYSFTVYFQTKNTHTYIYIYTYIHLVLSPKRDEMLAIKDHKKNHVKSHHDLQAYSVNSIRRHEITSRSISLLVKHNVVDLNMRKYRSKGKLYVSKKNVYSSFVSSIN